MDVDPPQSYGEFIGCLSGFDLLMGYCAGHEESRDSLSLPISSIMLVYCHFGVNLGKYSSTTENLGWDIKWSFFDVYWFCFMGFHST